MHSIVCALNSNFSLSADPLEDVEPVAVADKVSAKPRGKKARLQPIKADRNVVPDPKPQVGKRKPARRAPAPKSLSLVAKCKRNLNRLKEASTVAGRDVGKEKLSQTSAVVTRRRAQAASKAAVQTRSALAVKGEATKRSGLLSKVLSSVVKASAAAMKAIKPGKKEAKLEALKAVSRRLTLGSADGKPQECSIPKGPGRRRKSGKKVIAVKLCGDPEERVGSLALTAMTLKISGSAGHELAKEMRPSVLPCSERYPKRLPGDHHMQASEHFANLIHLQESCSKASHNPALQILLLASRSGVAAESERKAGWSRSQNLISMTILGEQKAVSKS